MTAGGSLVTETALARFNSVRAPRPTMGRARVRELTERQREILDELGTIFDGGFAHLSMAALAKRLNCSLRTLYALAPSRDELVLAVVDRRLRHIGRMGRDAIAESMSPLEALTVYLHTLSHSLESTSEAFARDLAAVPTLDRLISRQNHYVFKVTRALLDLAVEQGEMAALDTGPIAIVLTGLGWEFTRPDVKRLVGVPPKRATDAVVDVIVDGLRVTRRRRDGQTAT